MHPLVSAFAKRWLLEAEWDRCGSISGRAGWSIIISVEDRWIDEVMASCQSPKFLVGFLMGHNNKVYRVWLWDLNGVGETAIWLEDEPGSMI